MVEGWPLPEVEWVVDGRRLSATSDTTVDIDDGVEIRSTLMLKPDRRLNGRVVECNAKNEATLTTGRPNLAVTGK